MKFNQMPQEQEKLPTLLGSTWIPASEKLIREDHSAWIPVGEKLVREDHLHAVVEKITQKLGESGLPRALKFMSQMFSPMAETSPKDITSRGRWWETAWKRKREGGDECMNIPEAQKFSQMASILVHEVYRLDDATWSAICGVDVGSSCPKESRCDQLLFLFDPEFQLQERPQGEVVELDKDANVAWVRQGKEDPLIDFKNPAGQAPRPYLRPQQTVNLRWKEKIQLRVLDRNSKR